MNPVRGSLFVDNPYGVVGVVGIAMATNRQPLRGCTTSKPRRGFLFVDQSLLRTSMNPVRGSLFIDNPYGVVRYIRYPVGF
jgi:hypothetical protein